jgi:hypothetical protein
MASTNDIQDTLPASRTVAITRPANAGGGHAFMAGLATATVPAREAAMVAEILRGNVPPSLTRLVAVPVAAGAHTGTIFVAPDYLGVGSDTDFVRIPLNARSAQNIADRFGCVLPTTKVVDAIWRAASHKLAPLPWGPPFDASMLSTARFIAHSDRIAAQRASVPLDALVAGDKKDVVLTKAIATPPATSPSTAGSSRTANPSSRSRSSTHSRTRTTATASASCSVGCWWTAPGWSSPTSSPIPLVAP